MSPVNGTACDSAFGGGHGGQDLAINLVCQCLRVAVLWALLYVV